MKTPCNTEMNFAHRPAIIVMDNPLKAKEARRFKVMIVIARIGAERADGGFVQCAGERQQ